MNPRNENGLFGALERELRKSKDPLDAATLFGMASVNEHAATANRVSDYLGNMWKKGLVLRVPAPQIEGSRSRWLYVWKNRGPVKKPIIDMSKAIEYDENVEKLLSRPGLEITGDGDTVTLTLPHCTITIKRH